MTRELGGKALTSSPQNEKSSTRGYTVELREEGDGSWSALVPELPGLVAVGSSPNEVIHELPDVIDLWIETAEERGIQVPAPRADVEVSGRLLLRMPKDLHRALVNRARVEGTSLNTYVVSALSAAVGESLAQRTRRQETNTYWQKLATLHDSVLFAQTTPGTGVVGRTIRTASWADKTLDRLDFHGVGATGAAWSSYEMKSSGAVDEIETAFGRIAAGALKA